MIVSLAMRWVLVAALMFLAAPVMGRDNGQYAQVDPETREWFQGLRPGGGQGVPCCADADGTSDPNWVGKKGDDGNWHYSVQLGGKWVDVPDDAVVTVPNRAGRTIIWTYTLNGVTYIRCFMPGPMS